jgi:hypothetical protein
VSTSLDDYPQRWGHPTRLELAMAHDADERIKLSMRGFYPDWHRGSPLGFEWCDAGFRAFFGGRWHGILCDKPGRHVIGTDGPILAALLCDLHYYQVEAAGLVIEPDVSVEDFKRRYGGSDEPV